MTDTPTWELVLTALLVGGVFFLFFRGGRLKQMMEHSRAAPKDWPGVIWPLLAVVVFVILLIALARG